MNGLKKHRGLKRYYKNLASKVDDWSGLNFIDQKFAWFDLWHTHFDWFGYGNHSFDKRKPHLDKLFRHFELLKQKAPELKTDYQIWATILDNDSASDALYLHTPNPNRDNFPLALNKLKSENTLTNQKLIKYLDELDGFEKLYGEAEEAFCVVYKKDVGLTNWL
ncbi:hypothetical protein [Pedobacter sp. MW01-1-1]|uniref:hypothetical protein n=1 Tax=Pedobacter sp. MW01-1-1 TaxID=3383027 RepID=UPI003FEFEE3E